MNKEKMSLMRRVVKYDPRRAYFGEFTVDGLTSAYHRFKHTQDWDKPVVSAKVRVGKIDGGVICRALWNEMSYNPVRFGDTSPFLHNGIENIYHFCRVGVSSDFPAFEIIEKIRHKMIDFMTLNGRVRGQWYDNIDTQNGFVIVNFVDGHSDDNYKVLTKLREMIRWVANQNNEDFKHKKYRVEMAPIIESRHPNGIRGTNPVVQTPKPDYIPLSMMEEETAEDRLDKAEETARITAENRKYVPTRQYNQARADLKQFANIRANGYGK